MSSPLVDKDYLLQKFPGKGGWTYAAIPEVLQNPDNPFGWVKVRGSVDGYVLDHYKLMPMGEGQLFLPVKAAIRKAIGKEAGDTVRVILYADNTPLEIPEEIRMCFAQEPPALWQAFQSLPEGEQKAWLDWIYEAKKEETQTARIVEMLRRL